MILNVTKSGGGSGGGGGGRGGGHFYVSLVLENEYGQVVIWSDVDLSLRREIKYRCVEKRERE